MFIVGLIIGERQSRTISKETVDDIAKKILDALKLRKHPDFQNAEYDTTKRNYTIIEKDDQSTTDYEI